MELCLKMFFPAPFLHFDPAQDAQVYDGSRQKVNYPEIIGFVHFLYLQIMPQAPVCDSYI